MNKSIYLLIASILIGNFCQLKGLVLPADIVLVLSFTWAIIGYIYYAPAKKKTQLRLNTTQNKRYVWLIFAGIFMSMVSVYFYQGQSFILTFIAQRQFYLYIYFFVLLRMAPSEDDIIKFAKWYSILTLSMWALSIYNPYLFDQKEEAIDYLLSGESGNFGFVTTTLSIVVFYYYYDLSRVASCFSLKGWLEVLLWLGFFILVQNRSMLFVALLITIYTIFRIKSSYKVLLVTGCVVLCSVVLVLAQDIFISLYEETVQQLSDSDYNRWNAIEFFFTERDDYPLFCMIFGNGIPSAGTDYLHSLVQASEESYAFISDIGLLGDYFYFGILPLGVVYFIIFKVLRGPYFSQFFKFMCLHILLIPTIFSISNGNYVLFFCIIIYLYCYYKELHSAQKISSRTPVN